jgi:hypothetical protein
MLSQSWEDSATLKKSKAVDSIKHFPPTKLCVGQEFEPTAEKLVFPNKRITDLSKNCLIYASCPKTKDLSTFSI